MRGLVPLLVLTVLTVAQGQAPLGGTIHLTEDLIVNEGETLVLAPGARLTGSARVQVAGTLLARGTAAEPIDLAVPVEATGNASVDLRHARAWGADGAALVLRGGRVDLADVLIEGNRVGLLVQADVLTVVTVRNATFRDHETAVDLAGHVMATISNATFLRNAAHVSAAPADGSLLTIEASRLEAPLGSHPAVLVRADDDAAVALRTRNVTYAGGDVAVRIEGARVRLESRGDDYAGVRVALSLDEGEANVTGARFDTRERDVDAGPDARLSFRDVRFTPAAATTEAPAAAASAPSAWWIVGVGLVAAGGAVAWARLRPRASSAPLPVPEPEPETAPPPTGPVTELERRVLADIAAHPGTAQAAVAQRLGMTRQALHYHVKKLEARRLIRKEAHGRETRCTVAPGVEALLEQESPNTPGPVAGAGAP